MCVASAVGFILLLVAFLACGVGFVAPYWVFFPPGFIDKAGLDQVRGVAQWLFKDGGRIINEGMLGRCYAPNPPTCIWFWQDDFAMEKEIKDWHKAAQALYSFGYVILLSTLLLALLHLCCRCCCQKPFSLASVVGSLIVAGSMLIATAIAVFMAFQIKDNDINIEDLMGTSTSSPRFDWSCFVAVGGVACALISAVFFICEGCRHERPYDGYETARTI